MSKDKKVARLTLKADLAKGKAENPEIDVNKRNKAYLDNLRKSNNMPGIAQAVCTIMSHDLFDERLGKVTDNPALIPFVAAGVAVQIETNIKYDPRHAELAILAVNRGIEITGMEVKEAENEDIKKLKKELSECVKKQEQFNIMQQNRAHSIV